MPSLDLVSLDRDVAKAHAAVVRFGAELRRHPDRTPADPLEAFHHVAGRRAYAELLAYPASAAEESVRAGLLEWIHALTEVRTTFELEANLLREARAERGHVLLEQAEKTSYQEAWRGAVFASRGIPSGGRDSATRQAWLEAAAELAPPLAPLAREARARRVEVATRLGLALSATEAGEELPTARLEVGARTLLSATRDLRDAMWRSLAMHRAAETPRARLSVCLGEALATDAGEGWPARLTPHWLEASFREMCKDARIALELPRIAGASSFARGLFQLGVQIRVGGKNGLPFSVAKSPAMTDAHRIGFLFGALPLARIFHRKVLGLGERVASGQARSLARTALLEAAGTAARWLLTRDERPPSRALWEEVTHDLFDGPIDGRFMGVWPARQGDETPRLEALLTALPLQTALVSSFDEDWFRNPKAGSFLRARAGGPAKIGGREEELDSVALATSLGRAFEEALG
jgi:hypothetical protein